ncbi:hypothetical protein D3C72_1336980 [compost metagenome]
MRRTCSSISRNSCRTGSAAGPRISRATSRLPWITAIGLLISCATPAVSCPASASFSDVISCCRVARSTAFASSSSRVRSATLRSSESAQSLSSALRCCRSDSNWSNWPASWPSSSSLRTGPTRALSLPALSARMVPTICVIGVNTRLAHNSENSAPATASSRNRPTSTPSARSLAWLIGLAR